ncbi:MAG: hypothetical protein Q9164_007249 [Protoblastenia rupestris]
MVLDRSIVWQMRRGETAMKPMLRTYGTSIDASQLMDHIESYISPLGDHKITDHIVLGVSLGGHAAWLSLFHEPRVSAGIVVIGCCDYVSLMCGRARLSKRVSVTTSAQPDTGFIGSKDFPTGLHQAVLKIDPASLLLGDYNLRHDVDITSSPSVQEQARLRPLLQRTLGRKKILNLSGESDKLVPYTASEPTLQFLKVSTTSHGWADHSGIILRDLTFPGVGHEVSYDMAQEINDFVSDHMTESRSGIKYHI